MSPQYIMTTSRACELYFRAYKIAHCFGTIRFRDPQFQTLKNYPESLSEKRLVL